MWWRDVTELGGRVRELAGGATRVDPTAVLDQGCVLDDSAGPIVVGPRTRICAGAIIRGPAVIGADCLVGNQSLLRGPIVTGDKVLIGFSTEIKNARLGDRVSIGPMCFVADSVVEDEAYLGAMVRTSNQRLDRGPVSVREGERTVETGCDKLGCLIGAGSSLGIQVIVLPGRVIAPGTTFEPRITVNRNYPAGHYRARQDIERVTTD